MAQSGRRISCFCKVHSAWWLCSTQSFWSQLMEALSSPTHGFQVTWPSMSSQQMEDCLGGYYGPALDVMYMTSPHIPLARAQTVVPSLCKGNWKSSPWQGSHFLATLGGNHPTWWPAGHSVTASWVTLMHGGIEHHWSRA